MLKKTKKICAKCGEPRFILAKGKCSYCYNMDSIESKKFKSPVKTSRSNLLSTRKRKPTSNKKKKSGAKAKSIKTLKAKLWRIFSWFIRLRDSDENGYCYCITSGKRMFWKEAQAGHFQSRRFNNTMFNEKNSHAQSPYENCHLSGNQFTYGIRINQIYGPGTAEELLRLSRIDKKFTVEELEEMIVHYTKEVKRLLNQKNLK